jgi:peptidoglycan L-alanyl-D-glutamate endopeptidase CwlK
MRDIKQLHPKLQKKLEQLKALCQKESLPLAIGECLRTVAEQDALYAQGRTKAGKVVTNAKGSTYSSQHQWGIAVDFFKNVKGKEYSDTSFFKQVGTLAKGIGLGWGGDWKNPVDMPHLYLPDWGNTAAALKSRYGTPIKFFATWGSQGGQAQTPSNLSAASTVGNYTKSDFIKEVQTAIGAKNVGLATSETLKKTVTVSKTKNTRHAVIKPIQKRLNALGYNCGKADGVAGRQFDQAMKAFQKANGCTADGEAAARKLTWQKLLGMA